jgi:hypothetical protein
MLESPRMTNMNSGKSILFGKHKSRLLIGLAMCVIGSANADARNLQHGVASISCGVDNLGCLISEIESRLSILNQSLTTYNHSANVSAREASPCDIDSLESVSNKLIPNNLMFNLATEAEVAEASQGCRYNEVPTNTALWLLASALVGFVGASSKRRV